MHPAISVIFFTVLSGAGFGLIAMIGLGLPIKDDLIYIFISTAIAIGLAVIGLIASTFHLGHPERAWRAFSQWRSSWLSREGVLAVLTLSLFGVYVLNWLYTGERVQWLGYLSSGLALLTVFSTAMIYAQLKTVPSWHSPLTPLCYMGFSIASSLLIATALNSEPTFLGMPAILLAITGLLIAWLAKFFWWQRADKVGFSPAGSDTGTATGLGALGEVKLLEKPHSGENYLTREMVHQIGRKHAHKVRMLALLFGLALPLLVSITAYISGIQMLAGIAFILMLAGLFAERWLFFAEAKHTVSLYY